MSLNDQNGGYYAIKGFEYQIDKTILSILSAANEDDKICIEYIQDLNSDNYVMQIKYKETQKFTPSKISKPVVELLREFLNHYESEPSKIYYLYCYFLGQPEGAINIDLAYLNRILGSRNTLFTDAIKQTFLHNFVLIFSKDFQSQFSQVLAKITETCCSSAKDEEAVFYYANIANLLRKKVIGTINSKQRTCTKKEVVALIRQGKKLVFDSAFREFKGDQAYFNDIKAKFHFRNIDDFERFFIIQTVGTESLTDLKQVILKIKNKFYVKNVRSIKSGAPYIFLRNVSEITLKLLKSQLLSENHILRDGHDFLNADFNIETLAESATLENKLCLKFINNENNFDTIINKPLGKSKEIYQFYIDAPLNIQSDAKHLVVQIKTLSDITHIF